MPFGELIEQHRISLNLVSLHRERLAPGTMTGVIRQFSKRLILVEVLGEGARAAGFSLIRREDLTRVDRDTEPLQKILRAIGSVARNHPMTRELDLVEWRSAIASAQKVASSLRLHREGVGDPIVLACPTIQLTKHLVIGERPDPGGEEAGELALALDHLTRIDIV